ncbi:response regulator [Oceanibaculum nanhaiense]|uniref:response regulator n=1 Tax=Oceanibaculum nanhaiense TaxID=1909734 RepID=UPI003F6FA82C
MNLDFGILWIEDSYNPEEEENLKRRVREAGFIARIEVIPNGIGIDDLAWTHNLYHIYDIILLDYRLKDENGDELAHKVRQLFPSTTVLFYSGTVDEQKLRKMIAERQVEGVYCSARDRFIERTGALIDQTARALDRLSGMRGLAMRVVAECDILMKTAMLAMCNRDPKCSEKVSELDEDVLTFITNMKQAYETAISGNLDSRLATRAIDSAKLFKHFRRLTQVAATDPETYGLNQEQVERLRELRRISAQYNESVLKKRNILGHVVEVQGQAGWVLEGSSEMSVEDFPEIRRVFALHIDAFREMSGLVITLDKQ